ncbi:hypothetical protein EZV62_018337 [Acer yangbiense]|uniref:CCHC-type domain-containing protein n=1 Tax=Acer yangbiense TaxID=1000413 RepID=A0A5C7HJJ5_9ROSI|nr:hypothetical protein EZV62_018337 [Acer yangbiense]
MANDGKNKGNGNFIQPSIPRFDGHYDHWSMLMENFLRSKEFWSLVETGYVEPEAGAAVTEAQRKRLEELKLKDLKVKNYLFQAIDRTILETIIEKNTSKQIWDSMKRKYEGNARVKRSILQALRKEFETLEMKTSQNITEYFARVMIVANKMRIYGEQMQDVTIVETILRSLTDRFNYIVCSIEESKDIGVLSIDELQSSLIVHEQKFQKSSGEEQALKVTFEDRFRGRGRGGSGFRGGGRGRGRQAFDKTTMECYRCHKLGHFQYECPTLNKEANYAELDEEEEILLMSHVELHEARREDAWFLDFGCSNHMCGDKTMFCELNEGFRQLVKLGNNTRMTVLGKGNVKLYLDGFHHVVTDMFYVPELKNNLLSVGQLQEKGLTILIKTGMCKIYHPVRGLIIQTKMTANRMFILMARAQVKEASCFHAPAQDLSHLWHCRCPTLAVKDVTPKEAWSGVKPSVEHFRVFGCVSEESKGYRLYDPVAKRVVLLMDLEWGEEESGIDEDEANGSEGNETSENDNEDSGNASSNTTSEDDVNPNERREIHAPVWMRDYASGEGLSEEENEFNIALVASADPLSYEELEAFLKLRDQLGVCMMPRVN